MVAIPDTQDLLNGPLGAFLADQHAKRAEAKAAASRRLRLSALIAGPLMLAAIVFVPLDFMLKVWGCGFLCTGIWAWSRGPIKKAKKKVKVGINEGIAEALGLQYTHDGESGREFELVKRFDLVPDHERSHLEDFWSGDLEGHDFLLHEAKLRKRKGSGKKRRWVTVFQGAIIRIASGRTFHGTTLVKRAGKHDSWLGFGSRKDSVNFDGHRLDAVDMVHPDFDDRFEVWSDDQVEARYLVDPLYVERLLAMENAFRGNGICSLFVEGDIIVAVRGGNMFESGTINPDRDRAMIERTAEQLAAMGALAKQVQKDFGFTEER